MVAESITKQALILMAQTPITSFLPALKDVSVGSLEDVLNTNGCAYYQWVPQLIKLTSPKQVVELGGAMGTWALMALQNIEGKLYSITLEEHGLEFMFIKENYPNLIKIVGDDLDMYNWPKDLDLSKTDLWFFDSLHTGEQLRKELDLYSPFFKKETIILFDDIHMPELEPVWQELKDGKWGKIDCYDATDPCHYSGYGVCMYDV